MTRLYLYPTISAAQAGGRNRVNGERHVCWHDTASAGALYDVTRLEFVASYGQPPTDPVRLRWTDALALHRERNP